MKATKIRRCPDCGWHYVLVGGQKKHVCPTDHYKDPNANLDKAKGRKNTKK